MIVKIYGTKVRFPVNVTANGIIAFLPPTKSSFWFSLYGCHLGTGESGSAVIVSAVKL